MKKQLLLACGFALAGTQLNAQLTEDFEGPTAPALPTGWTVQTNATDGGFITGDAAAQSSQFYPIAAHTQFAQTNDDECDCNKADERLISPAFNLPASSDVYFLKFEYNFAIYQGSSAAVEISTDGGNSWTVLKTLATSPTSQAAVEWAADSVYLDDYNGQSGLMIAFYYDDQGGWEMGLGVDDIETVTNPASTDLANLGLNRTYGLYGQNSPAADFVGRFQNVGTAPITSFDLNYTIDGQTYTETINLNPALGFNETTDIYTHGTAWQPTANGTFPYSVFCNNVNGNGNDDNTGNDDYTGSLEVVTSAASRVAVLESFSSNTCGPCAGVNGSLMNPLMDGIDENEVGSDYAFVKYQQNYPAPGTDVSYNNEAGDRHDYYNVGGIPTQFFNGQNEPDYDWNSVATLWSEAQANVLAQWNWEAAKPARAAITAAATRNQNDLDLAVTIDAAADIPASTLHVALMNNEYSDSGTNGETEFHHVMRKMLPNQNGTAIGALVAGGQTAENFQYTYTVGTPTQGSNTFWGNDVEIVVWLQNNATGEVYNAQIATITDVVGIDENEALAAFTMFPNPANDNVNINFTPSEAGYTTIEVVNTLGQVMMTKDLGNIGNEFTYNLNVSNFENGLYLVNIKVGNEIVSKRLSVQK